MKDAGWPFADSVGLRDQEHGHRALPVQILVERREGAGPNEGEGLALTVREIEARVLGRAWWVAEERRAEFAVQHELPERLLHGLRERLHGRVLSRLGVGELAQRGESV